MLVTERPGRLRTVADGKLSPPLAGVPKVFASSQGGLHDVTLDRNFAQNQTNPSLLRRPARRRWPHLDGAGQARRRQPRRRKGDLPAGRTRIESRPPGCRIVNTPDNNLFLTMGDHGGSLPAGGAEPRQSHRQDRARYPRTGQCRTTIRSSGRKDAKPEIWTYGNRNVQGAALNPASSASFGRTSTARRAATRSTSSRRARTTAGR